MLFTNNNVDTKHQNQREREREKGGRMTVPHNTLSCVGTKREAGLWHCPCSWGEEVLPCLQKERGGGTDNSRL